MGHEKEKNYAFRYEEEKKKKIVRRCFQKLGRRKGKDKAQELIKLEGGRLQILDPLGREKGVITKSDK